MAASAEDLALFGGDDRPTNHRAVSKATDDDLALFSGKQRDPRFVDDDEETRPFKTDVRLDVGQPAPPKPTIGDSFRNLASTVGRGASAAVDLVSPVARDGGLQVPFHQLADPSYRRQVERGLSDVVTAGYAERAANALSPELAASAEPDEALAPGAREMSALAGSALPSPFRFIGGKAAAAIPGKGALSNVGRGVAAYESTAVPIAAATASDGDRLEAMLSAATDPAGLTMAAGPGLVQAGAKGVRTFAARAEERQITRALRDIEEGAGKRSKAALREAEPELETSVRSNQDLRSSITNKPTPKSDARLRDVAESIGKRAGKRLEDIYATADAASEVRPAPPAGVREQLLLEGPPGDLPGAARPPTRSGPALLKAADGAEPTVVAPDRAYHLDQNARAAERRADVAEKAFARLVNAGEPTNPEMKAAHGNRAAVREVAAKELRERANTLRAEADAAAEANVPPGGRPGGGPIDPEYIPPAKPGEPARPKTINAKITDAPPPPRAGGVRIGDALDNLDGEIGKLAGEPGKGNREAARQLKKIRDELFEAYGEDPETIIPSKHLRAEQSAYQRDGYGKPIPGSTDYDITGAKILANRVASKAVGDVVIKHVTGMSYEQARAAAMRDPSSVVGRLMRANDDVMVSNRIQALVDSRKGGNYGAPHRLTALTHAAVTGLSGGLSAATGSLLPIAVTTAIQGAPTARRALDAAAVKLAPRAAKVAAGSPKAAASAGGVARLIQAGRAGATRAQLETIGEENGIDPDTVASVVAGRR